MNNHGTEDYAETPEYGLKHTDEHADEHGDERIGEHADEHADVHGDAHTDERIEADEGDAATVRVPVESGVSYEHEHEDEDEERYDREEPAEHEALTTDPAEHEASTPDPAEHDTPTTEPYEHEPYDHEALTTDSAEPEPWVTEPDEPETPLTEPAEPGPAASEPLLAPTSAEAFLDRWSDVQTTFIEDPHRSVTEADALLTEVLTAYRDAVEQRREQISSAWSGDTADTEKMRLALLGYRDVITTMLPAHSDGGRAGAAA